MGALECDRPYGSRLRRISTLEIDMLNMCILYGVRNTKDIFRIEIFLYFELILKCGC
jgi:hypothetical protein